MADETLSVFVGRRVEPRTCEVELLSVQVGKHGSHIHLFEAVQLQQQEFG